MQFSRKDIQAFESGPVRVQDVEGRRVRKVREIG